MGISLGSLIVKGGVVSTLFALASATSYFYGDGSKNMFYGLISPMPFESTCRAFRESASIPPAIQPMNNVAYPFEAEVFRHSFRLYTPPSMCSRKLANEIQRATKLFFVADVSAEDIVVSGWITSQADMDLLDAFLKTKNGVYCVPLAQNSAKMRQNRILHAAAEPELKTL